MLKVARPIPAPKHREIRVSGLTDQTCKLSSEKIFARFLFELSINKGMVVASMMG